MKPQRASPRQQQVVRDIRERIVSGMLKPGTRLPQRTELVRQFDVSGITIQRALDQLADEGHLYAIPGTGTFVSKYPPHEHRYGIVLPLERLPAEWRRQAGWSHFWTAVSHMAEHFSDSEEQRLTVYYGINGHVDVPDYLRLKADIEAGRLAGLFLLNYRHNLTQLEIPPTRLPTLSLIGEAPAVVLDMASFFTGALEELRRRGRRRIAVLLPHKFSQPRVPLEALFGTAGFDLPPWRKQYLWAWGDMESIRNAVQALLRGPAGERPDGLIIADDHLVTYATVGIIASGLTVPDDLDVVAYANFPLPTLSHVPALRRGFDARTVLKEAVRLADAMRGRAHAPAEVLIPAISEQEWRQSDGYDELRSTHALDAQAGRRAVAAGWLEPAVSAGRADVAE